MCRARPSKYNIVLLFAPGLIELFVPMITIIRRTVQGLTRFNFDVFEDTFRIVRHTTACILLLLIIILL